MNCGASTVKYLLFIFNFIFFVSGIGILVIGAIVKAGEPSHTQLYETNLYGVSVLLIVVGGVVAIIAFFGCCGAIRESRCMLYTFAGFLSIIFIVEFAIGIAAFVYRDELKDGIHKGLNDTMYKYVKGDPKNTYTSNWDDMQQVTKCCGVDKPSDWFSRYPNQYPDSCCKIKKDNCGVGASSADVFSDGCYMKLEDEISHDAKIIGGVGIGVAFIQILGIVFACCLASILKN